MILLWKSCYKMLFNSIFRNVTITLLCITNKPTMLYAACPEKWSFHFGGWRGGGGGRPRVGDFAPSFWIFWVCPCSCIVYKYSPIHGMFQYYFWWKLQILCGSRKYPYSHHGWFFSFCPPPPWNFPSRGSFVDSPTSQEFPFFFGGGSSKN